MKLQKMEARPVPCHVTLRRLLPWEEELRFEEFLGFTEESRIEDSSEIAAEHSGFEEYHGFAEEELSEKLNMEVKPCYVTLRRLLQSEEELRFEEFLGFTEEESRVEESSEFAVAHSGFEEFRGFIEESRVEESSELTVAHSGFEEFLGFTEEELSERCNIPYYEALQGWDSMENTVEEDGASFASAEIKQEEIIIEPEEIKTELIKPSSENGIGTQCKLMGMKFSRVVESKKHGFVQDKNESFNCNENTSHEPYNVSEESPRIYTTTQLERSFECDKRPKRYQLERQLTTHKKTHSGELNRHTCGKCKLSFTSRYQKSMHYRIHSGRELYTCDICGKQYHNKAHLGDHIPTHFEERAYKCKLCIRSFKTVYALRAHARTHSNGKRYACPFCPKRFYSSAERTTHVITHTGEKPFECEFCGKRFSQSSQRRNHLAIHTGEKRHECTYCGKGFYKRSAHKSHILIHTGERHFKCEKCGKMFSTSAYLQRHDASIHRPTGLKCHSCDICGKSFSLLGLKAHSRTHMGRETFGCIRCERKFSTKNTLTRHFKTGTAS